MLELIADLGKILRNQGGVPMAKTHILLMSFLAGFLFSNAVTADPPPLEALTGQNITVDSGIFTITSNLFPAILYANGGTINTAPGELTLNVEVSTTGASALNGGSITLSNSNFNHVNDGLSVATGGTINATDVNIVLVPGPSTVIGAQIDGSGTLTLKGGSITVDGVAGPQSIGLRAVNGATLIADGTNIGGTTGGLNKSAEATTGGHIELFNLSITQNFPQDPSQHGALEVSGGSTISGDNIKITTKAFNEKGAFAQGGTIVLKNTTIGTTGNSGAAIWAENATFGPVGGRQSTIEADNTVITTSGQNAYGAIALFGGIVNLNGSIITTTGGGANGVYSFFGSTVNVTGSTVTAGNANAGQVVDGSVMNITHSELTGGTNGIRISDDDHTLGPDTLTVSGSTLTNQAGNSGEAAIRVDGAEANITLKNSTVNSGTGAGVTQHTFLNVTSIDRAGVPFSSVVNLIANSSTLNGDILVDATSSANVMLEHKSILSGAINENNLTGAILSDPAEPITGSPPLPPRTITLNIDGTSTWNMRTSSTLDTLNVSPGAQVNFLNSPFTTLVTNNLTGHGGIFGMNVDLPAFKGDLLVAQLSSQGSHSLQITNLNQSVDLAPNTALLVVITGDGRATFTSNLVDAGTFKYEVQRGNGLNPTPNEDNWYLVRADEVKPEPSPEATATPSPTATPHPSSTPVPEPSPGPSEPENFPKPLDPVEDLTDTANAAIGTYSSTIPLYYADMQTLVERMGELRLGIQAPAPAPAGPTEVGKGVVESKQIAPPLPGAQWGIWIRGFGNGMRVNNDVSRTFDQNVGGFQLGADKRFGSLWSGDVYLGVFGSYIYASRDFRDGGNGSTNGFSLGGYATWIQPQGWYADMVVKYTQMWNYFSTPTSGEDSSISTGYYNIPTVGGSIEVGKRFNFADHCFFIEPQAQLAGVWENGMDYAASNGVRVHGDDQTSLQGRLGGRVGMHFELSQGRAIEPYAKAEVIEEFLTGNTVTTNITGFDSHLSGTVGRFGGGFAAKLSQSIYIYGEYDYATGDHIQAPWSVTTGLRWQW